ncbi:restriction endonuclease [Pseudomonas savastanoi pv. phaseolicola]|uniref:BglII/BstYI family type II restriction endonuclease n=1 Tax=Pseudomonas savastanoi TaxID=29438 RepID=UPI000578706B|nr:BglII/BstYI family type II restriction endonuclease [Pseudomonas savastanoi]MBN3471568.1 restriction endonuclease [Pseudomonas savastanoi pv. phaseolicola]MBN3478547.1 restriction endonuclease [Pseudomonas savastanoi pv. phaseolicola]
MKIVEKYSHLNGLEYLIVHKPKLWEEIQEVIDNVDASRYRTKESKEVRTMGKMLYSPRELNAEMMAGFAKHAWAESRTSYWVTSDSKLVRKTMHLSRDEQKKEIEDAGFVPISSYNQTDFVKDRVAVEVQFGKYSFVAYDLFVKHMAFYVGDVIDIGIEILPMKSLQTEMSSGPGYYEGELYNLIRQGRGIPAVPLVVIGIAP